jgi:hypothetical protein
MLSWIKKHPYLAAFLGLALVSVFLFVGSLFVEFVSELCSYDQYGEAEQCAPHHLGPWIVFWAVMQADAHNGLITAISTVLLTWITYLLVRLGIRDSKTQEAQLRAYVSAIPRGLFVESDKETVAVLVQVRNAGQTPAFNLIAPAAVVVKPGPPYKFRIGEIEVTKERIGALPTITMPSGGEHVVAPKGPVTYADRIKMIAENQCLYVFGLIAYKDVFGEDCTVEFCSYLEAREFMEAYNLGVATPRQKIECGFKVATFANEASFNPDART